VTEDTAESATAFVDARGLLCPRPVIDLARAVAAHEWDDHPRALTITLLADDPAAIHDVPAWCRMRGCTYEIQDEADGTHRFTVTVPAPA
jgi:tRNA 2-thiouridine synthesizing protein A